MLAELVGELKAQGVELRLANVRAPVRDVLERSGVAQTIGEEHIYPSIEEGVQSFKGGERPLRLGATRVLMLVVSDKADNTY